MKRITSVLLVLAMVLSSAAIVGCDLSTLIGGEGTTTTTTNKIEDNEPKDLIIRMTNRMKAAGYDEMKLTAELYSQLSVFSAAYTLNIEIIDDYFCINGFVYDDISYVNDYDLQYHEQFLNGALSSYGEDKYEMLLMIQKQKDFYILKTDASQPSYGATIAVYEVGNDYYFLASYDDPTIITPDVVVRSHKATIE